MSPLEIAVTMYHREHDRWNQWALFFFGSVISVFLLWENLKPLTRIIREGSGGAG